MILLMCFILLSLFVVVPSCIDSPPPASKQGEVFNDWNELNGMLHLDFDIVSCEWEEMLIPVGGKTIFLPMKYMKCVYGEIILTNDQTKKLYLEYKWDDFSNSELTKFRCLEKYFNKQDKFPELLVSKKMLSLLSNKTPYCAGVILFSSDSNMLYFYLHTI